MAVSLVNQWAATVSQPGAFQSMPPSLASMVIALTPSTSVGGGSGTPTAGNWLFMICGWNQTGISSSTIGTSDDIHSFWRPGDVTKSLWAVSPSSGNTRTNVWYTANLARVPGDVYSAPSGAQAGMTCLILEYSGLGPWDVVTGVSTNYAAAATSLSLALPAPSAQALIIGAVTGDLSSAGQAFAPAGWTTLHTGTASNGTDHTCDTVTTSAYIVTSGAVSVSASASSATDLSGVLIGILTNGSSPVPAGANPNWPGRFVCEMAFGAGFETPPDQCTWTAITDNAWPQGTLQRLWSWKDAGGIQYQLGGLQAGTGTAMLANFDGAFSPSNPGSPYYSNALNANMSFQSGVSPWTGYFGTLARSSAQALATGNGATAAYSLQVTPSGPGVGGAISEYITLPVTSGTYTASAWMYSAAGWASGGSVVIVWYTSSHTQISTSGGTVVALPAATWTQVSVTATAPSNAVYAQVIAQENGTPSVAFWVAEAALVSGSSVVATGLVQTATPVRIRAALGTFGGVTYNRWLVVQKNILDFPEQRDSELWLGVVPAGLTDIWSVASASCPTPYRGEVEADNPYAWWPMDDVPLGGGVLPVTLRNFAPGNTHLLNIIASPNGVSSQDPYSTTGVDIADQTARTLPSVAIYSVGANQGWMYGDPQASNASYTTSGPVTASPGSASWQMTGGQGTGGANGWFLSCNDTGFPPLAGGVTVKGWFNGTFFGSALGYESNTTQYTQTGQPYGPISLCTLTTSSAPVAVLQLDVSGHLNLITYNGTTPTSHAIYTTSSLFSASWVSVDVLLTTTTWRVMVNGGVTADVSGTATGMTSAWSWLILNGDMGTSGGGTTSAIQHSGNVAYSHWAVFPALLPAWRLRSHYNAAATAYGLVPAPTQVQLQLVLSPTPSHQTTFSQVPDGSLLNGGYGGPFPPSGSNPISYFTFSVLATANIGSYTSGPSARTTIANLGQLISAIRYGYAAWVSLSALAPSCTIYTAASANAETAAAVICGSGEAFSGGFGASATGVGVCQIASGSGATPPTSASAFGDDVGQRLERLLGYGQVTYPGRSIDQSALLVQAATDIGGQALGGNVQNIADSDSGLLCVDNNGNICFRTRSHLATDTAAWTFTQSPLTGLQFDSNQVFTNDTQRLFSSIRVTPFSPDGASLAVLTPANAAGVTAAQKQYGARPKPVTSYLQSQTEMQLQANWLFTQFGQIRRRVKTLRINAASQPAAWAYVLGANPSDLVSVTDTPAGAPSTTGTYRVSSWNRVISFGADGQPQAGLDITADWEPTSYWS